MDSHPEDRLAARRLHRVLFGRPASRVTEDRFVAAATRLRDLFPEQVAASRRAMEAVEDLEALELAARWSRRLPGLTRDFQVMVGLGEVCPENFEDLVAGSRPPLERLILLGCEGLRSLWLLGKGSWLLRGVGDG